MKNIFPLVFILFLSFAGVVYAETPFTAGDQQSIIDTLVNFLTRQHNTQPLFTMQIQISPYNPAPNSIVRARVRSFSANLERLMIVWSVNGREIARGTGLVAQDVEIGPSGGATTIVVSVTLQNGGVKTERVVVNPGNVDLVWEAITDVPAWYRGARLPSPGARIRVQALPSFQLGGQEISPSTLTYEWALDGRVLRSASGVGRMILEFPAANLANRSHRVSVLASSASGQVRGEKTISIPVVGPRLRFYASEPLRGAIFSHALSNSSVVAGEDRNITVTPFFFSTADQNLLEYEWRIDGTRLDDSFKNVRSIVLSASESNFAQTIAVEARLINSVFQNARASIRIQVRE